MIRQFEGHSVELLAPAGNFSIFEQIVELGCDALYFGGKKFNMRLHRKDYNFSDNELAKAVKIAHSLGKKAYITVNNLYNQQEIAELKDYLLFLAEIAPDAILIQDLGVISIIKQLNINLPLHSSVMMNVHNLEMVQALKDFGVKRIVMSRESPLAYGKYLADETGMEMEYFVHGDMCVAHGSRCLYSGMLFGQSSNRGRCLKPCRWDYQVERGGVLFDAPFPLAVKDICLYRNIPELINNHITSFKIEGRMRDFAYLSGIISAYSNAIDRYLAEPLSYDRAFGEEPLIENRKRDFSTGYAFGVPGLSNINRLMEGTGAHYSSGKMFSTATTEKELTTDRVQLLKEKLKTTPPILRNKTRLGVKVQSTDQARQCFLLGVDRVYLSGDVFLPNPPWTMEDLISLASVKGKSELYLATPHMSFDSDLEEYRQLLLKNPPLDGLLVTNMGAAKALSKGYPLAGDYQLNLLNTASADIYRALGVKSFTLSPEATLEEAMPLISALGDCLELIVHGSPTVMFMEHDLFENAKGRLEDVLYLKDEGGNRHPIYRDQHNRGHMLLCKDLCYLPLLKELVEAGLGGIRIEGGHFNLSKLSAVISCYQQALANLSLCEKLFSSLKGDGDGFTLGSFDF